MNIIDINNIHGFKIGSTENAEAATGVTVIISEAGATAGVDVRGGGPATRETDLLKPENMVQQINAVVLSGGSAYGLEAASGVMDELEKRNVGFETGFGLVPIVCGASLFDLCVGKSVTFLEFIKKSEVKPIDKYPSQQEQAIIDEWNTSKSILWQSCMKVACEVEKAFMCGEKSPTRDEACKNICVSTNNLYEASLRKQRNLPPIPETTDP